MKKSSKNIFIRRAALKDASKIAVIHKNCVLKTNVQFYPSSIIKEWIKQIAVKNIKNQLKNSYWFVLKLKNKIIGFCQFSLKEKTLYQINISPKYQNKKYGKLLYDFIEKYFSENNINKIYLNSTLNAINFYKNLGFKKVKQIKFKLNKTSIKMVKMKKEL